MVWGFLGLLGTAIAAPIAGVYLWSNQPGLEEIAQSPPTPSPESTDKANERVRIVAQGRIEPAAGVLQVGAPINEIVSDLRVKEGDWVKQGDMIAYLKTYQERQSELEQAQQDLRIAQTRLHAETEFSQAQLKERQVDVVQAPLTQDREISAQKALIGQLKSEKRLADLELQRYQSLVAQGAAPRRELDQRQAQVEQLSQQMLQAEENLTGLILIRDRELANIKAQVNTAQVNTDRIRANSDIKAAQEAIKLAKIRVDNSIIRSPKSGRVLRIVTKAGETIGDNGQGQGILVTLGNTKQMQVIAEVNEADINQVRVGQQATLISRNKAFPGELKGTVKEIGQLIFKNNVLNDDPSALRDARVVEVKVDILDSDVVAKLTNLQVEVKISLPPDPPTQPNPTEPSLP